MEKIFAEWEFLQNRNAHNNTVPEQAFPSQAMEEEALTLGSNMKDKDLNSVHKPSFPSSEAEPGNQTAQDYTENHEEEEEEEEEDKNDIADNASNGKRKSRSMTEEDREENGGELVESKERKSFRFGTLLKSAGFAAAALSFFVLQKSITENQKIKLKICNKFQNQQEEVSVANAAKFLNFSGFYDEWL